MPFVSRRAGLKLSVKAPLFTMQKSYKDGRGNEGAGQNQQDVAF